MGAREGLGARLGELRQAVAQRGAAVLASPRVPARLREVGLPGLAHSASATTSTALQRGAVLRGLVWAGGASEPRPGVVVLDQRGAITYLGPLSEAPDVSDHLPLGGVESWIGPGIVDAHVHLGFGDPDGLLRTGLVAVRDLGAPQSSASTWRTGHRRPPGERPVIAVAGPVITSPGGYPTRSWGAHGYAAIVYSPANARQVVHRLAADGADLIKIALEPGGGAWPVPEPRVVQAVVEAAHDSGLAVVAHALSVDMVRRAVNAGVDELAHTPSERLPESLVEQIAAAGISVVSTLQTFFSSGVGRPAAQNAADLFAAGVQLRYGTDFGHDGTRPGVDPRELDRLADTGMGRLGALRAATQLAARAPGIRRRTGLLEVGQRAALVVLPGNPLDEPGVWRSPTAVLADGRLLLNTAPASA